MKSDEDDDFGYITRRVPPNSKHSSEQELHEECFEFGGTRRVI